MSHARQSVRCTAGPTSRRAVRSYAPCVIRVEDLVKRYKKAETNAVDGISFQVKAGEFFVLLGPNGAGKTTTISILTTTLSPTGGGATIDGSDVVREASAVRRKVGIIFQRPSLDQNLTAEENVRFHAVLYRLYPTRRATGSCIAATAPRLSSSRSSSASRATSTSRCARSREACAESSRSCAASSTSPRSSFWTSPRRDSTCRAAARSGSTSARSAGRAAPRSS